MGTRPGILAALVVLALAAVVSATYAGPAREAGAPGSDRPADSVEQAPAPPPERPEDDPQATQPDEGAAPDITPGVAPVAVLVLVLAIGALVAIALAAGLRLVLTRRRLEHARPPRAGASPAPGPEPAEEPHELSESISRALDELDVGDPENAIVAAWLRLERLLHRGRLGRHPADTPAEYAERARASYELDGDALDELAALYREARFSRHPLTPAHRERARDCLTRLLADLQENAP